MTTTVATSLRLGHGFHARERNHILELLHRLEDRLRSFADDQIHLELSVKERGGPDQRTTIEAKLGRLHRMVATSHADDIDAAVIEVRDDLVRQVTDATGRQEARRH